MPYWYEYKTDLVGDRGRSHAPRVTPEQLRALHSQAPGSLDDPSRRLSWGLLLRRWSRFGGRCG
jgi:hypothetical protein